MLVNAGKLQILTVAAMLVLISGGIGAYAHNSYLPSSGAPAAPVAAHDHDGNSTSPMFKSSNTVTTFSSTMSSTSTISSTYSGPLCQPPSTGKSNKLVLPITATGSSTGSIYFTDGKGCLASITTEGGVFNVQIGLRYAKSVTQYNVVLVANGTSYALGNMVTGPEGQGQMDNQVLLKPGTYIVSIQIFDTSSNPGQSTLVLQTAQGTIVSPPFPASYGSGSHSGSGQGGSGDSGNSGD